MTSGKQHLDDHIGAELETSRVYMLDAGALATNKTTLSLSSNSPLRMLEGENCGGARPTDPTDPTDPTLLKHLKRIETARPERDCLTPEYPLRIKLNTYAYI